MTHHSTQLPASRNERRLMWGVGVAVGLACAIAFSLPYAEADLWGHVQYGRDALREGLPATTTYSYTAEGYPWINHENLSELAFAWIVDRCGVAALSTIRCLLGLAILGAVVFRATRAGVSPAISAACALVGAVTLTPYWQIRPQIVSYFAFAVEILLLDSAFRTWPGTWAWPWHRSSDAERGADAEPVQLQVGRSAWCLPLLFALWVNAHGGFLAGLVIALVYLATRFAQAWWVRRQSGVRGAMLRLTIVAVACVVATLFNPYGLKLHAWLLQSLSVPRPEITEWHPIGFSSESFLPFVLLVVASAAGLLGTRCRLDPARVLILLLVLWQAVSHERHVPFFTLLVMAWMPHHWQSMLQSDRQQKRQTNKLADATAQKLGYALVAINLLLLGMWVYRLSAVRVDRATYPVSALQYMVDQNLEGRLVVTYNWAQYAIGALGVHDSIRVGFDGRFRTCYPQEIVDEHFDFVLGNDPHYRHRGEKSPPFDPTRVLQRGEPNLVLISRRQPHSVAVMQRQEDWTLLYQDSIAQLWGRCSVYDDPSNAAFLPKSRRGLADAQQEGLAVWPAFPQRPASRLVGQRSNVTGGVL